jgi:hypothetical protein
MRIAIALLLTALLVLGQQVSLRAQSPLSMLGFGVGKVSGGGGGNTQIKVTFVAAAGGGNNLILDHASAGISASPGTGTEYQTTLTPIELLFSLGHGFTLTAGSSVTSDLALLSTAGSSGTQFTGTQSSTDGSGWNGYSMREVVTLTGGTVVVVVMDFNSASTGTIASTGTGACTAVNNNFLYYMAASATYASATPTGFTARNQCDIISTIQVQ